MRRAWDSVDSAPFDSDRLLRGLGLLMTFSGRTNPRPTIVRRGDGSDAFLVGPLE